MWLIINTYGSSLSRKGGRFCVKTGDKAHYLSAERLEGILLTTACHLTTDALMLALDHQIPVILMERDGEPAGMFWSRRYGSIATIRRRQIEFSRHPEGTRWVIGILDAKARRQGELLEHLAERRPRSQAELRRAARQVGELRAGLLRFEGQAPQACAPSLRGIEGSISRVYFQALGAALPKPYRFSQRSRRPALDRFNAALNYLYGILYHLTETSLLMSGLDPYLPVLHADEYARPAFAYDYIEAWRPWADRLLVDLCLDKTLKSSHFEEHAEGIRLNPEGRRLAAPEFLTFLQGKERYRQKNLGRQAQLFRESRHLAGFLLESFSPAA